MPFTSATARIDVAFSPGGVNSQGWLNWFRFFCRRNLVLPAGQQLPFRDWQTVGNVAVGFTLTVPDAAAQVWDVTDPFAPVTMQTSQAGNELLFSNEATRLREYIAFGSSYPAPMLTSGIGRCGARAAAWTASSSSIPRTSAVRPARTGRRGRNRSASAPCRD